MHILIADSDSSSRKAFGLLLERKFKACEILEADDLETLIQIVTVSSPDLLLLDWKLYCSPAPEISLLLRKAFPEMKIVLLSIDPNDAVAAQAVGVEFVHKGASPDNLLTILEKQFPPQEPSSKPNI